MNNFMNIQMSDALGYFFTRITALLSAGLAYYFLLTTATANRHMMPFDLESTLYLVGLLVFCAVGWGFIAYTTTHPRYTVCSISSRNS